MKKTGFEKQEKKLHIRFTRYADRLSRAVTTFFSGKAVRPHTLSLEWPYTAYTSLRTVVETVTRKAMGRGFVNGTLSQ